MHFERMHRISFKSPDLTTLRESATVVDMHFHTRHSDGHNSVAEVAAQARLLGIGLAVTDHNEIRGALEMAQFEDLLSIPGIEVTSAEGSHVLVYFYAPGDLERFFMRTVLPAMGHDIMSSTSLAMEAIIEGARRFPTVVILPHPFSAAYTGVQNSYFPESRLTAIYEMVDGIEVINAENMNKWNLKSTVLGFNLGKGITGGSDGHQISHMGKAVTICRAKPCIENVLDAIRQGQVKVIGKEIDIFHKVTSNTFKLKSNIRNYPDLLEKNIRYSYALFNAKRQSLKETVRRSFNGRMRRSG